MSDDRQFSFTLDDLAREALQYGCSLGERQLQQFDRYRTLLAEWNRVINLTAISDSSEVLVKHFLDSLSIGRFIMSGDYSGLLDDAGLLDVGSGAGLPGIAFKIAFPELPVVLCDSLKKRVNFLEAVIADLQLTGIRALHGRAEELAKDQRFAGRFPLVAARAVARFSVVAEWCIPFVSLDGYFLALKGPTVQDEVAESSRALRILNCSVKEVMVSELPLNMGTRSVVVVHKDGPTPSRFPRKPGEASRNPL